METLKTKELSPADKLRKDSQQTLIDDMKKKQKEEAGKAPFNINKKPVFYSNAPCPSSNEGVE